MIDQNNTTIVEDDEEYDETAKNEKNRIGRMHIDIQSICYNEETGLSSIKRNSISDRFDDIH